MIHLLHEEFNCQKPFSCHKNYSQHGEASLSDPSSPEAIQIWPKSQETHGSLRCRRGGQSPALSKAVGITAVLFSKCCKFTASGIHFCLSCFLLVETVSSLLRVTHKTPFGGFWLVGLFACFYVHLFLIFFLWERVSFNISVIWDV